MSIIDQTLRIPPIRSIREFVGGNEWTKPTFNPNEFGELQKNVIANLIYYQTKYGAVAIPFLLLVAFFRPTAIIFGLLVIAVLLIGFVCSTRQNAALITVLHDRPIVILVLLLAAAFLIIRMFSTVLIFLIGIALPLALIVVHRTARTPALQNKVLSLLCGLSLCADLIMCLFTVFFVCNLFLSYIQALSVDI